MKVEQLYTGCLAQGAYYIESNGEAAIIDPLRETEPYIELAKERGAKIKYILETHFHADFVSGHLDLAKKTGAQIVFGPMAQTSYEAKIAQDGEVLTLGDVSIKVLHTPGHTMESSCFLLTDENGKAQSIFTGDTLFIGDVGRPDLAIKSSVTKEDLAGMLFDSLRNKIMPLPDEIIVYPAHGAGSACGKNMSDETSDTLGNQKETNYALDIKMSRDAFIKELTEGLLPPPQYFAKNAALNKTGYTDIDDIMLKGYKALDIETFKLLSESALILDTRSNEAYAESHIPDSWFIGINGSFAPWVGTLVKDLNQPIVFLSEPGREEEVVTRLARVGYDNTLGYLEGGIKSWEKAGFETEKLDEISAEELKSKLADENIHLLDVRKPGEYKSDHSPVADNFPLDFINDHLTDLDKDKTYYVHCQSGYRSKVAISILKSQGYNKLVDVSGGYKAMAAAGVPMTESTASSI